MVEKILIAGGSGAVGKHLIRYLKKKGFEVSVLSRTKNSMEDADTFCWDIDKRTIDSNCFKNVSHIIQLSGANISERRWSAQRREEIVNSRVNSTDLLFQSVKNNGIALKTFISASAIGYYGDITDNHNHLESDLPGNDFLADTCVKWEKAADQFLSMGVRTVKIRTGIVLMPSEGVIKKLRLPVKFGLGTAFGSGRQYFSWIHIDDLCGIYYKAIIDGTMNGSYNAVSPFVTTNRQFIDILCSVSKKPRILPNIPSFFLKMALGELANTLLNGSRVSAEKILKSGFIFQYPDLEGALDHLINTNSVTKRSL